MTKQTLPVVMLFLIAVTFAAAQAPPRDLNQIRTETSDRNRAIDNYDRSHPNRITGSPTGRSSERIKIPGSEVRKYVLAAIVQTEVSVVKVAGGDTFLVNDGAHSTVVRIIGIDAPEDGQKFYAEAKQNLSELLSGKKVLLQYSLNNTNDAEGYFLARVLLDGKDVGFNLVENGFAWRKESDKYFFEKKDAQRLEELEAKARIAKTGLWSELKPQKPWEYKKDLLKEKAAKKTAEKN